MVSREEVISELKTVNKDLRIAPHSFRRAKERNADIRLIKQKIKQLDVDSVRPNNQEDPRYSKTYKITVKKSENKSYEMPIYFNLNGNEIYVKSVWIK